MGENRIISLDLIEDSGAGEIPAGETFTITVTEIRHPDETLAPILKVELTVKEQGQQTYNNS